MNELTALYSEMEKAFPDRRLVFGEGNAFCPRIMLIGEAPGAQEEEQRRPFVGKAGQNLNEFLQLAGLERGELYVSNVVKFRPTELGPTGRTRNRKPSRTEIAGFTPFLLREIALVQPRQLVTLGNTPLQALLGEQTTVGEAHGQWLQAQGIPLFALYHPASMIYRPALRTIYANDILRLAVEMR